MMRPLAPPLYFLYAVLGCVLSWGKTGVLFEGPAEGIEAGKTAFLGNSCDIPGGMHQHVPGRPDAPGEQVLPGCGVAVCAEELP